MKLEKLHQLPVLGGMLPDEPIVSIERSAQGKPIRYCIDNESEQAMQRQRLFTMVIGGPAVLYAASRMDDVLYKRAFVALLGLGAIYSSYFSYRLVGNADKM
ncbi:hypothetical protein CMI47_06755 [Candidatus Pacearchaeota archaeon]|nr:hypothetical protein [Candidatus Pacearchaeota archaeon]|tara:strand:+ start:578 stop:883 length:306 start_codon:yes stop_codon:yes gene_type:complete